ncbi:MAG: hypothetical protein AAF628_10075 [Planctomycetota bacterium]
MRILPWTAALLSLAAPLCAQDTLIFTTLHEELTRFPKPTGLWLVDPGDVMCVTPSGNPDAMKFAPHDAWLTLIGDDDNDASIWEDSPPRKIDALLWKFGSYGPSPRELFFSTAQNVAGCVNLNGTPRALLDGDVARVQADGQFQFFLRERQIRNAFQTQDDLNVDAVAADCTRNIVYLSFEEDHVLTTQNAGVVLVEDGGIVAVRVTACGAPSTIAGPGALVAHESEVDGWVANSGVRDRSGMLATAIKDTDGLHVTSGTFQNQWGQWNNLFFCGEALTGTSVLVTAGGGSIAIINGVPMGRAAAASTGERAGLQGGPVPHALSLNGLELRTRVRPCHFVLETPDPVIAPGDAAVVEASTGTPTAFLLAVNPNLACYAHPTMPWANSCFPDLIQFQAVLGPVAPAGGYTVLSLGVPLVTTAFDLVFQGVTVGGTGPQLSTPLTIEVQP